MITRTVANGEVHNGDWSNDLPTTAPKSVLVPTHPYSGQSAVLESYSTAVRPASAISFVALQMKLSEGQNSSGNSIVMDGYFTAAHAVGHVLLKVKLFKNMYAAKAKYEYAMMNKLYHAAPDSFVRAYTFLEGCHGQIQPHVKEDKARCADSVCIVMERGTADVEHYFSVKKNINFSQKLAFVDEMLSILISSSNCGVVLYDFKPANVVLFSDNFHHNLKAIDFGNCRQEGEVIPSETTAAYSSPEVARDVLARGRGENPPPLLASRKMDIMALGWTVYEILNNMKSYSTGKISRHQSHSTGIF